MWVGHECRATAKRNQSIALCRTCLHVWSLRETREREGQTQRTRRDSQQQVTRDAKCDIGFTSLSDLDRVSRGLSPALSPSVCTESPMTASSTCAHVRIRVDLRCRTSSGLRLAGLHPFSFTRPDPTSAVRKSAVAVVRECAGRTT